MKQLSISKSEARALLVALDWCEGQFRLGKLQESVRSKLYEVYPEFRKGDEEVMELRINGS